MGAPGCYSYIFFTVVLDTFVRRFDFPSFLLFFAAMFISSVGISGPELRSGYMQISGQCLAASGEGRGRGANRVWQTRVCGPLQAPHLLKFLAHIELFSTAD
jgi:hypothetical protein